MLRNDVAQLLHKVHLQGATDATVLKRNQAVVAFTHDTTLLNQVGINVDLTYIVDDNGKLDAFLVGKNTVKESCFTAAQITSEQKYRCFFVFHFSYVVFILSPTSKNHAKYCRSSRLRFLLNQM